MKIARVPLSCTSSLRVRSWCEGLVILHGGVGHLKSKCFSVFSFSHSALEGDGVRACTIAESWRSEFSCFVVAFLSVFTRCSSRLGGTTLCLDKQFPCEQRSSTRNEVK